MGRMRHEGLRWYHRLAGVLIFTAICALVILSNMMPNMLPEWLLIVFASILVADVAILFLWVSWYREKCQRRRFRRLREQYQEPDWAALHDPLSNSAVYRELTEHQYSKSPGGPELTEQGRCVILPMPKRENEGG